MKALALLAALLLPSAWGQERRTPQQAQQAVAQALPPEVAKGAASGDIQKYLESLPPERRAAALRALDAKRDELGSDPAVMTVLGRAYAGLGSVGQAREAAQRALRQDPANQEAKAVLAWAQTQEKLGRAPSAGGYAPSSLSEHAGASGGGGAAGGALASRVQSLMSHRSRSAELDDVVGAAGKSRGQVTMADLNRANIFVETAPAGQERPVQLVERDGKYVVSIRQDALEAKETRAAAMLGNGLRQAQVDRDESGVKWAWAQVRGWVTQGRIHKELDASDDPRTATAADRDVFTSRALLDAKTTPVDKDQPDAAVGARAFMVNMQAKGVSTEALFEMVLSSLKYLTPAPPGR